MVAKRNKIEIVKTNFRKMFDGLASAMDKYLDLMQRIHSKEREKHTQWLAKALTVAAMIAAGLVASSLLFVALGASSNIGTGFLLAGLIFLAISAILFTTCILFTKHEEKKIERENNDKLHEALIGSELLDSAKISEIKQDIVKYPKLMEDMMVVFLTVIEKDYNINHKIHLALEEQNKNNIKNFDPNSKDYIKNILEFVNKPDNAGLKEEIMEAMSKNLKFTKTTASFFGNSDNTEVNTRTNLKTIGISFEDIKVKMCNIFNNEKDVLYFLAKPTVIKEIVNKESFKEKINPSFKIIHSETETLNKSALSHPK